MDEMINFEVGRDSENYDVCKFIQSFVESVGGVWDDDEALVYKDIRYGCMDEIKELIVSDLKMIMDSGNVNEEFIEYSLEAIEYLI